MLVRATQGKGWCVGTESIRSAEDTVLYGTDPLRVPSSGAFLVELLGLDVEPSNRRSTRFSALSVL